MADNVPVVVAPAPRPTLLRRAAQAVANTIAGVSSETWFGPLQPLPPLAPDSAKGRAFDYLFGWNLNYIPRSTERVSFEDLKNAAESCDPLILLLETRKDRMKVLKWEIRPKEEERGKRPKLDKYKDKIDEITNFLRYPDKRHDWGQWLPMLLDQNLVYDAVSIYRRKQRNGKPYAWELIDGKTIKVLLNADGRTPLPPSPAYQQILKGIPAANYSGGQFEVGAKAGATWTTGDMLYFPENPRADRAYGYSRVEQCLRYINLQLARMRSQLGWYEEGNVPEGFIEAPKEMTVDQIGSMQQVWDSIFAGIQAIASRRKVWWLPAGSKYTPMKEAVLKSEFDEWVMRILCYAFSEDPSPFIRSVNRATAETAEQKAQGESLLPSMEYVARVVNTLIYLDFGYTDIEFAWNTDTEFDPAKKAVLDNIYARIGATSLDEIRESRGQDAMGGAYSIPMFATPNGWVPVDPQEMTDLLADRQPPAPVIAGPGGAGGAGAPKAGAANAKQPKTVQGAAGAKKPGGNAEKLAKGPSGTFTRPLVNGYELEKWLEALPVTGSRKLAAHELYVTIGKGIETGGDQPSVVWAEGDQRHVGKLLDGRPALFFKAEELDVRMAELGTASESFDGLSPHVVLTEDAADLCPPSQTAPVGVEPPTPTPTWSEFVEPIAVAPYSGSLILGAEEFTADAPVGNTIAVRPNPNVMGAGLGSPVWKVSGAEVDAAAAVADPNPSRPQISAGNYRHGHVVIQGLDVSIENAAGSRRSGVGPDGTTWSVVMPVHYGYLKRTTGADAEHIDVYLGTNPDSDRVWVVDQVDADTGKFDEHKCFVGFDTWAECQSAYIAAFSDGRGHERLGHVSSMSMTEFKAWIGQPQKAPRSMFRSKSVTVATGLHAHDLRGAGHHHLLPRHMRKAEQWRRY